MNDKSLEVLKQYEFDLKQASRGRGGMILDTNAGMMLLMECDKPDKYYERENALTRELKQTDFCRVDTFVKNQEGKLVTEAEDGRKYMVKDWFIGRECNVKCVGEVSRAVEALARLHNSLEEISERRKLELSKKGDEFLGRNAENGETPMNREDRIMENGETPMNREDRIMENGEMIMNRKDGIMGIGITPGYVQAAEAGKGIAQNEGTPMKNTYLRHMKELKLASNYLRNKRNKSEFEQIAYKNIGSYYDEAVHALERMNDAEVVSRFQRARERGELCHGNYNYHNVICCDDSMAVCNFDHYRNECQISDLYQFMRKILEKYDWDIQMAYKMLDEYDRVRPLADSELELLSVLFTFPEKFWKVINFYFNSSKSWIPRKSVEKLKIVVGQNEKRQKFLETFS